MASRQAIANSLSVHSRGVDRADANLLGSAYHADATVDYGFIAGPASQFVSILSGAQKGQPVTLHRTSNMWIKVEGDRARSESYIIAYLEHNTDSGAIQRLIGGRYLDSHECRNGAWRFTHRTYVMDWNSNRPSTANWREPAVSMANDVPRGGQGGADVGRAYLASFTAGFKSTGVSAMSSQITDAQIDAVLSKQALHELGMAYARGVDRADEKLLASIFHEDATVMSGVINGSGAEFARGICAFVTANLTRLFHSVANEWFDVRGEQAIGESYVIASMTAGGNDTLTGGRYIDAYERRNGVWKFKTRNFVIDWSSTNPSTFESGGMYEALKTRGCYGSKDPVYAFWNKP
jgi:hypothetical protein